MNPSKTFFSVLALCGGCLHPGPAINGPESVARSYSRALEEGRLEDAWALSAALDRDQFDARYSDPAVRKQRAHDVARAAEGQALRQGQASAVALEVRENGWKVVEPPTPVAGAAEEQQARALVAHFLSALEAGDFEAVFGDLSSSWRARYTPGRLKSDFETEPAAAGRLQRIRASLGGRWEVRLAGPQLPVGEGKALKLVREGGALKVAALE